jgi:hypothetical protein
MKLWAYDCTRLRNQSPQTTFQPVSCFCLGLQEWLVLTSSRSANCSQYHKLRSSSLEERFGQRRRVTTSTCPKEISRVEMLKQRWMLAPDTVIFRLLFKAKMSCRSSQPISRHPWSASAPRILVYGSLAEWDTEHACSVTLSPKVRSPL